MHLKKWITLFCIGALKLSAAQNDIFPTDYIMYEPEHFVATLYFSELESSPLYRNGVAVLYEKSKLSLQALRMGYTTSIHNLTASFGMVATYTTNSFEGSVIESIYPKSISGFGDVRLGSTVWLLNNNNDMEYFAISAALSVPLGSYDSTRSFNIGENRYKGVISCGYVNRFYYSDLGEVFIEISPEAAFFGENNNANGKNLKQAPSYAFTGYLRYRPIPYVGLFIGSQINRGGETTLNGIRQNNEPNNTKMMFGGTLFIAKTQIILRHAQDTYIENGFKNEHQTTLRFQWFY